LKSAFHIAQIKGNLSSAIKIAQGSKIEILLLEDLYCQIDGEPWLQKSCKVEISLLNRVPILSSKKKK